MLNVTCNHHFVAQVEQRLNAIDSTIPNKNQRIYSFQINDRESYGIELTSDSGVKIEKNLSFDDLFSFDILNEKQRINFEKAFGKYEQKVGSLTGSLLNKVKLNSTDIKEEVLEIFVLKLLNTFRNPYCIEKTLNTIGMLSDVYPASDELRKLYAKIDNGYQPERENIASAFSVTVEQYSLWMESLFMILIPQTDQGINLLELLLKNFFESSESFINVYIQSFSGDCGSHNVLLSDRGFTLVADSEEHTAYGFNLTSSAFIRYTFTDIKTLSGDSFSSDLVQDIISLRGKQPAEVKVHATENELEALSRYNKNLVYQSFKTVYCKSKQVYGL